MRTFIGAKLLSSKVSQSKKKPFEIYDNRLAGFTLRVQPTGVRSYYARFGRNRRIALGKVGALLADEARERCQKVLGNVAHGRHPMQGLSGLEGLTLNSLMIPMGRGRRPIAPAQQPTHWKNSIGSLALGFPNRSQPLLSSASNHGRSGA